MTSPKPKDSQLGKGYSFIFAIALTLMLGWQSIDIRYANDSKEGIRFSVASRELDSKLLIASIGLIATILGLPTDAIAMTMGRILTGEKETDE